MQSPRHLGASPKGLILFSFIRFTSARYGPIRALEANSAWGADKICRRPLGDPQGDIGALRDALHELMWKSVGIFRDGPGLRRAETALVARWRQPTGVRFRFWHTEDES